MTSVFEFGRSEDNSCGEYGTKPTCKSYNIDGPASGLDPANEYVTNALPKTVMWRFWH